MEQIFPSPVDDVDVVALYANDARPAQTARPWVMCNMISSADGGVAIDGVSGGLGGPGDKVVFSAIRAVADVIVVGAGTVLAENYRRPQTPVNLQEMRIARGQSDVPRLALVSRSLSLDLAHRVFDPEARPLVITTSDSNPERRARLEDVADIITAGGGEVDLGAAMRQLYEDGARTVLLEGGPTLNGAFVDAGLIDELCLSFSPMLLGGSGPRIVAHSSNIEPLELSLVRTLRDDSFLFHRYVRADGTDALHDS